MRIHRDHHGEALDFDHPKRLGHSELGQHEDLFDPGNRACQHLGGAANCVQIDRTVLGKPFQSLGAHASLPDNAAQTVAADDIRLIGLLANRGRGTSSDKIVAPVISLGYHRTTVIDDSAFEVRCHFFSIVLDQPRMGRIAARDHASGEFYKIPDLEVADRLFADREFQLSHVTPPS